QEIHAVGAASSAAGETDSSAGVATPLEKAHLLAEPSEPRAFGLQVVRGLPVVTVRAGLTPSDQAFISRHHRRHLAALELRQSSPALVVRTVARLPFADWKRNRCEYQGVVSELVDHFSHRRPQRGVFPAIAGANAIRIVRLVRTLEQALEYQQLAIHPARP